MGLVAGGRGRRPPLGGTISQCNMEEEEGRLRNPPKINHEKRNQETRSFKLLHRREAHMGLGEVIEKEKSKEEGRRERKKNWAYSELDGGRVDGVVNGGGKVIHASS